jgi:hypothetical protein
MRHMISSQYREQAKEVSYSGDFRMSGGDQKLARDPAILTFLARAYAEERNGRRPWPMFLTKQLGDFLTAAGVDIGAAVKADENAMEIPAELTEMEVCMNKMHGASFLAHPAGQACLALRRRSQMSTAGRAPAAEPRR